MKKELMVFLLLVLFSTQAHATTDTTGPWGIKASAFANLSSALASPITVGQTVVIDKGMPINNKTLPADRHIKIIRSGSINPASGKVFNFNGQIPDAGNYRIFSGTGTIVGLTVATPYWF